MLTPPTTKPLSHQKKKLHPTQTQFKIKKNDKKICQTKQAEIQTKISKKSNASKDPASSPVQNPQTRNHAQKQKQKQKQQLQPQSTSQQQLQQKRSFHKQNKIWESMVVRYRKNKADIQVQKIVQMARTQCGSRHLQQILQKKNPEYYEMIFLALIDAMPDLVTDLFGNYLFQHVFVYATEPVYRRRIIEKIAPDVVRIACDRQGTRALQRILQLSGEGNDREEQKLLISVLSGTESQNQSDTDKRDSIILQLMEDLNGCHVTLALVNYFPYEMVKFIFELSLKEYKELAKNRHGLCVLKKCVSLCPSNMFIEFSARVFKDAMSLVNHQYGNYLLQHILERSNKSSKEDPEYNDHFAECNMLLHAGLKTYYGWLSRQKFSSNVVEKCLGLGDTRLNTLITKEILVDKEKNIPAMLRCGYGNYVLQALLSNCTNADIKPQLIETITEYIVLLRPNIKKKWERLLTSHGSKSIEIECETSSTKKMKGKNVSKPISKSNTQIPQTTKLSSTSHLAKNVPTTRVNSFRRINPSANSSNSTHSSRGRKHKGKKKGKQKKGNKDNLESEEKTLHSVSAVQNNMQFSTDLNHEQPPNFSSHTSPSSPKNSIVKSQLGKQVGSESKTVMCYPQLPGSDNVP